MLVFTQGAQFCVCGSRVRGEGAGKDFQGRNLNRLFKGEQELLSFNGHSEDEYHSAEGD